MNSNTKEIGKRDLLLAQASFVFVDRIKLPIEGLTVKIESVTINSISATDKDGHAFTTIEAKRGEQIKIYIQKRSGKFELKGTVTPKRDINAYTIVSPEFHLEATTKLTLKQELEEELNIPTIKEGEIMTVERLFGELAPFVGAAFKITEIGQVTKDFPKKKTSIVTNPETGKKEKHTEIEHHYKVVKTDKPKTIVFHLLGSRLNYPNSEITESKFKEIAERVKYNGNAPEIAAVKAVTYTEADGGGYFENGLPKILFERHKFYKHTAPESGTHPYAKFPDICNPKSGGYRGGAQEYIRLIKAAKLDKEAAIKSCSWGAFQVLAEYSSQLGYSTAAEIANECMRSIDAQIDLFVKFMTKLPEKKRALKGLYEKDWATFTYYYNGSNWKKQNPTYPAKMAEFYEKFKI